MTRRGTQWRERNRTGRGRMTTAAPSKTTTGTPQEPVVDYLLVAEFDIEKGSTISFQYPHNAPEDTQLLAELMLPDGVHKRDDDWTVFFLQRPDWTTKRQKESTTPM